jgi:hypothetical protein
MTAQLKMAWGRLDAFHRVYLRIVDERARWIGSQSAGWNGPLRRHSFPVGFDTPGRFPYIPARHITPAEESRSIMGGISNRMKEIKRRRHRKKQVAKFQTKLKKATTSEKLVMAEKLRRMTPGADVLIAKMGLAERKRG